MNKYVTTKTTKDLFDPYNKIKSDPNIFNLENFTLYRDIVLLYSPSKVGSTTIASSIRTCASDKYFVMHSHDEIFLKIGSENGKIVHYNDLINNNNVFNKKYNRNRKIFVIDIFRTPLERKISEFFQHIAEFHFNNTEENLLSYDLNKIIERFNCVYNHLNSQDYFTQRFMLPHTVLNTIKFDFDKKYMCYESNGVTYIKLRLDDVQNWGTILSELLGTEIIICPDYKTSDKIIGPLYKKFVSMYKLPENYLNSLMNCRQLKKYMTENERIEYLTKWKNQLGESFEGFSVEQFEFYTRLCRENNFYRLNTNDHYSDDGCVCSKCMDKRKMLIKYLKNPNGKKRPLLKIKHKYDYDYNNAMLLRLFHVKNAIGGGDDYEDTIINYFNFF